jgi:hypothetical protein
MIAGVETPPPPPDPPSEPTFRTVGIGTTLADEVRTPLMVARMKVVE